MNPRDATCLLCGDDVPPSHVSVWRDGLIVGSLCGEHPMRDVILRGPVNGLRLVVHVTLEED
jgi:hypothetical protein